MKTREEILELFAKAENGTLPSDFKDWALANETGWTVAHEAAKYNHLPKDFNQWNIKDNDGWTVAHEVTFHNNLPENFNNWELKDNTGFSVAHVAAFWGYLPDNFDRWNLKDNNGQTVADIARKYGHLPYEKIKKLFEQAKRGTLPKNFKDWDLKNERGWTIAHEAAGYGNLPKDFDRWDMASNDGWTVAHVAATWNTLPADFKDWGLADKDGWTVAHEVVQNRCLPEDFKDWGLCDKNGITVAHEAVANGYLPMSNSGLTTSHMIDTIEQIGKKSMKGDGVSSRMYDDKDIYHGEEAEWQLHCKDYVQELNGKAEVKNYENKVKPVKTKVSKFSYNKVRFKSTNYRGENSVVDVIKFFDNGNIYYNIRIRKFVPIDEVKGYEHFKTIKTFKGSALIENRLVPTKESFEMIVKAGNFLISE